MKNLNEKDKKPIASLILGLFVLISALTFAILGGGAFFYNLSTSETKQGLHDVFGGAFYFIYFTIQTNLFLGIMLIIYYFKSKSLRVHSFLFSSVVLITLTFIIFWTVLAPATSSESLKNIYLQFDQIVTHLVNPLIGFIYLIIIRKKIIVNKRSVGWCSLYIGFFLVINVVLYASSVHVDTKYENGVKGNPIYGFIDIQHAIFMNFEKTPALGWIVNMILIIFAPFFGILFSYLWLKITKIETTEDTYYLWMERIKTRRRIKNINNFIFFV